MRKELIFIYKCSLLLIALGFAPAAFADVSLKQDPQSILTTANDVPPLDADESTDEVPVKDPHEKFNRAMFGFNEVLDKIVLKPVAMLYTNIVPKPLAKGISNIYANIDTIPTVLNDVLQGNFYQGTSDAWRFILNTTIGVGGFFDVASNMGLEPNTEDFGLTLARWGYTDSTYLVLPFIGPTTFRDGVIGWPVNYYFLSIYPYINPTNVRYTIYGVGVISKRADLLHFQGTIEQLAFDRYLFMRDAYSQRRKYQIQRNNELGNPYLEKNSKAY